jgi:hypothetical protein
MGSVSCQGEYAMVGEIFAAMPAGRRAALFSARERENTTGSMRAQQLPRRIALYMPRKSKMFCKSQQHIAEIFCGATTFEDEACGQTIE